MTEKKVQDLKHGVYKIYWHSGGMSLAAVGSFGDGSRWMSPVNWISGATSSRKQWRHVKKVEAIITNP